MLSANEIERRFHMVQQAIGQAAQACSAERNLPRELRDCIQRIDRQSDLTRDAIQSLDALRIRQMVDHLEQLGDRAQRVVSSGVPLTPQMKSAVNHMHNELSELKLQLH
jgi:ribosome recycling factor